MTLALPYEGQRCPLLVAHWWSPKLQCQEEVLAVVGRDDVHRNSSFVSL